ncbi:hypothetical protein HPB48_007483 [Haemaphysalis longicornis]|uniref:Uncharacterized protein n=1 Tax=Haemaphysalis longicornis TaxID=44386 RepID=A0A9J6GF16_HAELO|nr:hypothetical protein HPB48_007483 [Haemaphysalis longicornis]
MCMRKMLLVLHFLSVSDKTVKEESLPAAIVETVEAFKKYVTTQKEVREEIFRVPSQTIAKVQEETAALQQLLSTVENGIQRNAVAVERLKRETSEVSALGSSGSRASHSAADLLLRMRDLVSPNTRAVVLQDLKNAEIAHHTKETPMSLQYENTAPTVYFQKLVEKFNQQMKLYKEQIEELEQHFASLSSTFIFTPAELTATVKKLHTSFVSLAAQLQTIHDAIQRRKNELSLQQGSGLAGDLGSKKVDDRSWSSSTAVTLGPTPFSSTRSDAAQAMASAMARAGQPTMGEEMDSRWTRTEQNSHNAEEGKKLDRRTKYKNTGQRIDLGASFQTGHLDYPCLGSSMMFGSSTNTLGSGGSLMFGATTPFKPLGK